MVAIKAHQAQSFLKTPDPRLGAFLFFGTDSGLVSERAHALARAVAARETPEGEILRFDDQDLDDNPERLAIELQTMPMFGGRKVIRAIAGRRLNAALLKPLVTGGRLAATLIVEAGNLRPDEALRSLFEKSDQTAAIACYGDEDADLGALAVEILKAHGMTIAGEARELLVDRLGADRALSRGEIEKLALYAAGRRQIETSDVEAVVGDGAELTLDQIPAAAADGDGVRAARECDRWVASGESPQAVILAVQRHFQRLHRLRAAVDQGRPLDEALRQMRPPLHFKQKDAVSRQVRAWTLDKLGRALGGIATAAKAARLASALEAAITERLLLDLARLAASSQGAGRPSPGTRSLRQG